MAKDNNGVNLGFEKELWQAADALRSNMDAAEYKHIVLGLIFLKYISDAFEEQHSKLEVERGKGADPEDSDEYRAVNIFWVPKEARWSNLKANAKQPTSGNKKVSGSTSARIPRPRFLIISVRIANIDKLRAPAPDFWMGSSMESFIYIWATDFMLSRVPSLT